MNYLARAQWLGVIPLFLTAEEQWCSWLPVCTPRVCSAPYPFWSAPTLLQCPSPSYNLPSLFTVGKRKTILCKIASGEWELLYLTAEIFLTLFIIPIYCHLFTPLWSLSVCLSVYFRYINCAPNKCAFTKGWVTNHLPWLAFMVIWPLSKTSVLAHLQHCVAGIQMLCRAFNAVGHGSQQLSSQ